MAYEQANRYDEASVEFQKCIEFGGGDSSKTRLARLYYLMGRRDEAHRMLAELLSRASSDSSMAYQMGVLYAAMGDKDQAFAWLTKPVDEREGSEVWLKVDPQLDSLRQDERFTALMRRVGLAQ
jgi:tetratricopeptide (TPR) repeat protein